MNIKPLPYIVADTVEKQVQLWNFIHEKGWKAEGVYSVDAGREALRLGQALEYPFFYPFYKKGHMIFSFMRHEPLFGYTKANSIKHFMMYCDSLFTVKIEESKEKDF